MSVCIELQQPTREERCITLVKQTVDSGCGIACLAMVTCQPYETVKALLAQQCNWSPKRKRYLTHTRDLVAYLNKLSDITARKGRFPGWSRLHGTAIIGVNRHPKGYHWVLVIRNSTNFLIIDPMDAEVYQGEAWVNDADDGYLADSRSCFIRLHNFSPTHIRIE